MNQHTKCIQMSTNKPCIAPEVLRYNIKFLGKMFSKFGHFVMKPIYPLSCLNLQSELEYTFAFGKEKMTWLLHQDVQGLLSSGEIPRYLRRNSFRIALHHVSQPSVPQFNKGMVIYKVVHNEVKGEDSKVYWTRSIMF